VIGGTYSPAGLWPKVKLEDIDDPWKHDPDFGAMTAGIELPDAEPEPRPTKPSGRKMETKTQTKGKHTA
jgi:hypothetical protein